MKKKRTNPREESTLLQEIIQTYRYPDGTLNGIAVFISTLALVLLLILGHFMILGIKNIRSLNSVSASELTLNEIEEYITDSYLDAVDEYTDGDISHEAAKRKILNHIAEYLDSSSAFTDDQKSELLEVIAEYVDGMNLDEYKTATNKSIQDINSSFAEYVKRNALTLDVITQMLQNEIDANNNYTKEELDSLKKLHSDLVNTELDHFNKVNEMISDTQADINNNYNSFITKIYGGIPEWSADKQYQINDFVLYNNSFYKNLTGNNSATTPNVDTTNWQEVSITTVINNNYNTFLSVTGASDWQPGKTYNPGEYVIYKNIIYKCIEASTGDEPDSNTKHWEPLTLTGLIDFNYQTFINTVGAKEYDLSASYQAGDYVIKDGELYRATDSTSGAFDSSKWEKTSITANIDALAKGLDELALKSSADLETVNSNLTDIINKNKSLTDAQREEMLKVINDNADASSQGLSNLYDQLTEIINSNETNNANEREKLLSEITSLQNNTASHFDDYEQRVKALENKSKATTAPTVNKSGENAEFDFGYKNGVYGYWISNSFYPF